MFAVKTDRSAQHHIQYANSNVINREFKYTYKIKERIKLLGKALPPCLNFLQGCLLLSLGKVSSFQTDLSSGRLAGQCQADLGPYQSPLSPSLRSPWHRPLCLINLLQLCSLPGRTLGTPVELFGPLDSFTVFLGVLRLF